MASTPTTLSYSDRSVRAVSVRLHRYCIFVAVCTFILLLMGSAVTTTGSGLAVPDWPTTYGQNMFTYPPSKWVGGIFYEHTHRLVAAGVGLLTIILCAWTWLGRQRRLIKWLATAALAAVCTQGLLGGMTVVLKLPTVVSVAHAGLAQLFFCLIVSLAVITAPRAGRVDLPAEAQPRRRLLTWARITLLCVYLQIVLGAFMRHTQSGLAIPDFPLAYGRIAPLLTEAQLESINQQRVWADDFLPPVTLSQIWIHYSHRIGAGIVGVVVIVMALRVLREFGYYRDIVLPTMLLVGLLVMQLILGAMTVWSTTALLITTAHISVGTAMLASAMVLVLKVHKLAVWQEPLTGSPANCTA